MHFAINILKPIKLLKSKKRKSVSIWLILLYLSISANLPLSFKWQHLSSVYISATNYQLSLLTRSGSASFPSARRGWHGTECDQVCSSRRGDVREAGRWCSASQHSFARPLTSAVLSEGSTRLPSILGIPIRFSSSYSYRPEERRKKGSC